MLNVNTDAIRALVSQRAKFIHSSTPQVGDIALWEGHVGIVSAVDSGGKFKMIHASGVGRPALENKFFTTSGKYRSGTFYGYYRPIEDSVGREFPLSNSKINIDKGNPKAHPNPSKASAEKIHRGHSSGDDGTFPLSEVTIVPSSEQANLPRIGNSEVLVPQIKLPQFGGIPPVLPKK